MMIMMIKGNYIVGIDDVDVQSHNCTPCMHVWKDMGATRPPLWKWVCGWAARLLVGMVDRSLTQALVPPCLGWARPGCRLGPKKPRGSPRERRGGQAPGALEYFCMVDLH